MKITVILDAQGGLLSWMEAADGATFGLLPDEGETVHTLEILDELVEHGESSNTEAEIRRILRGEN